MNSLIVIGVILVMLIPFFICTGSVAFLIMKFIERQKEKENEHFDDYDKY